MRSLWIHYSATNTTCRINDLTVLHTDTSFDDMLEKNFPLKWEPVDSDNLVSMTGYADKVKSEIMGLCLACMRDREHDKSDICL